MTKIYVCYEDYTPEIDDQICSGSTMILRKAFTNSEDAEKYCEQREKERNIDYYFQELELEDSNEEK